MNNFNDYVYFVLIRNSNASYGFTGYMDSNDGQIKTIDFGKKDHKGNPVPHRFKFDRAHRTIRVHKNQIDIVGNNIVEFLRNFPECGESPNGHYVEGVQTNMWFKEVNEGKDAGVAVEAKLIKLKAETTAANLEDENLQQMAILCGTFDTDPLMQKHRVLEYAGADPSKFLELYSAPERYAKALLSRAIKEGLVERRGAIFAWKNVTIGANEELAVAKLIEDEDLARAIETNLTPTGYEEGLPSTVEPKTKEAKSEMITVPEITTDFPEITAEVVGDDKVTDDDK